MAKKSSSNKPANVGSMRFFHKLEPIRAFLHMKAPRKDKKDKRQLTLTFRMPLNGSLVRSAPDSIQTAYNAVLDHGLDDGGIKHAIEGVSIEIWETEKNKKASEVLEKCTIEKLEVREISSSKGDPSIVLKFEVVYPWDPSIWRFMGTHYAGDVALRFDSAQASLLDLADLKDEEEGDGEEEESQPDLLPEDLPDGKTAAAADN